MLPRPVSFFLMEHKNEKLLLIAIIHIGPELMVVLSSFRVLSDVKEKDTCCFGLGCSSAVSLYFWPV